MYPTIDKEKTGKRIRKLMEERNISVRDVRDSLSLESVQSVYYWFNGRNIPTIDNLYALSELLQVPIDVMICGNRKVLFDQYEGRCTVRVLFYYEEIMRSLSRSLGTATSGYRQIGA